MPKRYLDYSDNMPTNTERVPPAKAQKTERSHEENQERAYIAASRRADRSLEARVQSARMASEIHRRRTGRGLKVTEEIVLKEEMYEEEDDELPRHYRYLTAHLQTNSPDMNSRVNAYITTQAAMATMARYNEINKLFSESFPSTRTMSQQYDQSAYIAPTLRTASISTSTNQSTTSPSPVSPTSKKRSFSEHSHTAIDDARQTTSPTTTTISSPPALTPTSAGSEITDAKSPMPPGSIAQNAPMFPTLATPQPQPSAFTSEVSNEVKMMAKFDLDDPMAMHFLGGNPDAWMSMFGQQSDGDFKANSTGLDELMDKPSSMDRFHEEDLPIVSPIETQFLHHDFALDNINGIGTPGGGDSWESFVDFDSER